MGAVTLLVAATLAGCGLQPENYDYYTMSGSTRTMTPHPVSNPAEGVKFTFMPIVGAPTNSADDLYRAIRGMMARDQLTVVNGLDEATTYRVRIHLNAVATNTWTTLVYQVDIHDATGQRVHTFGGQFMASAGTGDPWAGIKKSYLTEVAAQIEGGIHAWTTSRA
jgi:hypothetical protein